MRTIYLCGHGSWNPGNGFTTMPKGCSMTFYTHHAKTMLQDAVEQIVGGQYHGEPHQVISQYMSVPNMTLSADDRDNVVDTRNALATNPAPNAHVWFVRQNLSLSQLFDRYGDRIWRWTFADQGVAFHWTCCRYVDSPNLRVRGRSGFNAGEDLIDDIYIFRDRMNNDAEIRRVPR